MRRASWREGVPPELEKELYRYLHTRLTNNLSLDVARTAVRQEQAREAVGRGKVDLRLRQRIACARGGQRMNGHRSPFGSQRSL